MCNGRPDLLLVETVVGSHVVWHFEGLHVVDLGPRNLVRVLDWAPVLLLVADHLGQVLNNSLVLAGEALLFISLVGVLLTGYSHKVVVKEDLLIARLSVRGW